MIPTPIRKTFQYGKHSVTLETGEIARQADGAVLVSMSDTVVLVTAVGRKEANPDARFFPLTVNYQEKTYAAGRIPGGFFKREGRPSEKETLTSRLIDRPIRPLFPKGFMNEVQVIATLMSSNPEIDGDIPAMIGTSAALTLSGIPFNGPIGAARVGYIYGQYVLNPTATQLESSDLDLVVAGHEDGVNMIEVGAAEVPEKDVLAAIRPADPVRKPSAPEPLPLLPDAPQQRRSQAETAALHTEILARLGPSPLSEDQPIRDLARSVADHLELLANVGPAAPDDRRLAAVGVDDRRRRSGGLGHHAQVTAPQAGGDQAQPVSPESEGHRGEGAQVQGHIEGQIETLPTQNLTEELQMSRTGYGKKLGQTLNHTEHGRLPDRHGAGR